MYRFPDLTEQTRLNMLSELEFDIRTGLFYEPSSMTEFGLLMYPRILSDCFRSGSVESLEQKLSPSFFRPKSSNGRKIPSSIRQTIAFGDFNRYYVRALLLRALSENKKLCVYRAKESVNERRESKLVVNRVYFSKIEIWQMLEVFRDYGKLFANSENFDVLKPNSGLSLKLIGSKS